jgi:hypothetical protein
LRRGQAVIGFTEAELGFFLLLVALGAVFAAAPQKPPATGVSREAYDSVVTALSKARDSLRKLDSLRSRLAPSCREKGLIRGPLFSVAVAGRDRFIVDGEPLTMSDLLLTHANEIRAAHAGGCIHEISVRYAAGLTADDLWRGLVKLRARFRTSME